MRGLESCSGAVAVRLANPLAECGFRCLGSARFSRGSPEATQLFHFRGRFEYRTSRLRFDCTVGVHHAQVEKLLRPERLDETPATVACPIHSLRQDRRLVEWYLDEPSSVRHAMRDIRALALPFLDRHVVRAHLRESLESEDPADWFMLDADGRICVLAALLFTEGDRERSFELLNATLHERRGARPAGRWPLQQLRTRLANLA